MTTTPFTYTADPRVLRDMEARQDPGILVLPAGWSFLHDMFNEATASERRQLAWRWLWMGFPRLAWEILRGKVSAASITATLNKRNGIFIVNRDGEIRRYPETPQETLDRLLAEHEMECDESAQTGVPMELDLAKFSGVKAALKATCSPRETFPQPFPLGATS